MPKSLFSQSLISIGLKHPTEFQGESVTPSDSVDLPSGPCTAIYVAGAGNVSVNLPNSGVVTALVSSIGAGQIVRINASRILNTGTTATGIYALYPAGNL